MRRAPFDPYLRAVNAALVLAVLALGVMPLFAAEPTAQLGVVSGTVAVIHANGSAVQPAGAGTSLGPGDRISTVGKSSAIIELPGIGQIELGANTTIIVHELRTASGATVVTIEIVQGMIVNRQAATTDTRLAFRIVDPSGQAVAYATSNAVFGVGRDENGNVPVACSSCAGHPLTFPGDGPVLHQGGQFTRTFTQAGAFMYFCEPHPQMTAFIEVQP